MELAGLCDELSVATKDAADWISRNPEIVRNEKDGILKDLRHAGRLFRSCGKAAGRKMCAGVFGPSQAGKSYLISALARGADNRLDAVFGDQTHDFISEINPEGGKESTGLVTRFTLTPSTDAPAGFPVRLALLSETDIVKIIANTYYADCEHKESPQSNINATLEKLRKLAGSGKSRISLDDMEDLREYISNDFRAKPRVQELERSYWDEAEELGPRLDLEGRIQLYSLIWDEVEEFTSLLRKLLGALDTLGYPEICYAPLDSLIPRDKSIIDVATLSDLEEPQGDSELEICAAGGKKARLPRSVVTALTAELSIVMAEKPADYFEHTDLLDFPGYRSRYKFDDVRKELKKPGMLKELFLRGKVAYLFQRYSAQRELNSMLLCIGPSNQEVQDLPGVINEWVAATHGESPEDRVGKKVSLFLILTKFDMEFEDKKGAPSLETRWDNRLHASLLDFFGKQHDWPKQWTPDRGFDNIYLLRNPNFRFEAIMDFDGDTETGVRPQRQEYVDKLRAAFLSSPLVAEHFANPQEAWQEAMSLNDGGISHIRHSLSPLCDPSLKDQQLLQNIKSCSAAIGRRLRGFYQTDDKEELRRQKLGLIKNLFASMGQLELKHHRLGQLIRSMTVSDTELLDLHQSALRKLHEQQTGEATAVTVEPELPDIEKLDFATMNPFAQAGTKNGESEAEVAPQMDEAQAFATAIEAKWIDNLHKMADDPALQAFFMLTPQQFGALAQELADGAKRLGLGARLAKEFRKTGAYVNTSKSAIAKRQAAIAAIMLNRYVDLLGYDPANLTAKERTIHLPGSAQPVVFEPRKPLAGLPVLAEKTTPHAMLWFQDWLNALAGLILENVNFDGKQSFDPVENVALGSILAHFDKAA